jgi:hypothetical protein
MAIRRNADGSVTVGIIPEEKPEEKDKKLSPPEPEKKQSRRRTVK